MQMGYGKGEESKERAQKGTEEVGKYMDRV